MQTVESLTKRELECLYYAAQDKGCRETASSLHVSHETVKAYRKAALRKLGCRTMAGALMVALRRKLLL